MDIRGDFDFGLDLLFDFFVSECKKDPGDNTSFSSVFFFLDLDLDLEVIFDLDLDFELIFEFDLLRGSGVLA